MLTYLSIKDFGIFDDVQLEIGPGLSVFTGETGAGKSMIVDAVMACLGHRTSGDAIRTGEDRATLELAAVLPGEIRILVEETQPGIPLDNTGEIVFQRDILPERSYLRCNGKVVTMSMVQGLAEKLVDIHGQQDFHSLMKPQNYLSILDSMSKSIASPRLEFETKYKKRFDIIEQMKELTVDSEFRRKEIDLLSFQINEIDKAGLKPGEEEDLRQQLTVLSSVKRLTELAQNAYDCLYRGNLRGASAFEQVGEALSCLKKTASIDSSAKTALDSLEQVMFSLESALDELRDYKNTLEFQPGRLSEIESRLDLIQRLKSKYGESLESVLDYKLYAEEKLARLLDSNEILEKLRNELKTLEDSMCRCGKTLTRLRKTVAGNMQDSVTRILRELGMPGACFTVRVFSPEDSKGISCDGSRIQVFPHGFDKVEFFFTANPGEDSMPVNKVASGGEISRLMLAMKSFMEQCDPVPTLIFDEIDAGVGGKAGQALAERLKTLGRFHQVLCVTHLAVVAAVADNHYVVSKEEIDGRTYASVRKVTGEDRVLEIARMLSGTEYGVSLEHARELLEAAKGRG